MARRPRRRRGAAPAPPPQSPRSRVTEREHEGLRRQRLLDGEQRGQVLVVDDRAARGAARLVDGRGDHQNTGWPMHCTRPGARIGSSGRIGPKSFSPGMSSAAMTATTPGAARTAARSRLRMRACARSREAERRVQRAAQLGNVVDVDRLAGDVQMRRLVADAAHRRRRRRGRPAFPAGARSRDLSHRRDSGSGAIEAACRLEMQLRQQVPRHLHAIGRSSRACR